MLKNVFDFCILDYYNSMLSQGLVLLIVFECCNGPGLSYLSDLLMWQWQSYLVRVCQWSYISQKGPSKTCYEEPWGEIPTKMPERVTKSICLRREQVQWQTGKATNATVIIVSIAQPGWDVTSTRQEIWTSSREVDCHYQHRVERVWRRTRARA